MASSRSASGSCLCGAVRFTATLPSQFCAHCHCSMCRRNHGAGYVTWFAVSRSALKVDCGADDLVRYDSSEHGTRSFCRSCGSSLFCENTQHPDRVDIPLGVMTEPIDRSPQFHVFFDSRVSWVTPGDDLPRLGGNSGVEPLPSDKTPKNDPG